MLLIKVVHNSIMCTSNLKAYSFGVETTDEVPHAQQPGLPYFRLVGVTIWLCLSGGLGSRLVRVMVAPTLHA